MGWMLKHKESISKQQEGVRSLLDNILVEYVIANGNMHNWNGHSSFAIVTRACSEFVGTKDGHMFVCHIHL